MRRACHLRSSPRKRGRSAHGCWFKTSRSARAQNPRLARADMRTRGAKTARQLTILEDAPFLSDQRHAVKDYNLAARPVAPCYAGPMRKIGPVAVIALLAALDASWTMAKAGHCRAQGRHYELGQTVCLTTPNGPRLATCRMVLNNSSWQVSQVPCSVSLRLPPDSSRSSPRRLSLGPSS